MKEFRFHGRRLPRYDHTAPFVEAARLLAQAGLAEGKQVQFRPPWLFLRGYTPEAAHLRVATEPIETYSQEYTLDLVAVTDASILNEVDVTAGLKVSGVLLINSPGSIHLNLPARPAVANLTAVAEQFAVDLALPVAAATALLSRVVDQESLKQVVEAETKGAERRRSMQAIEAAARAVTVRTR
jgi:pyruvate ferredoxin oxidoreductase gamma subunit